MIEVQWIDDRKYIVGDVEYGTKLFSITFDIDELIDDDLFSIVEEFKNILLNKIALIESIKNDN